MADDFTILVGTCGWGAWISTDGGTSFRRPKGIASVDLVVRGLTVDPHDSRHVLMATALHAPPDSPLVGTTFGLHESFDGGATWGPVESFARVEGWRVTFDPTVSGRYLVGTRPATIYRTDDAGKSFDRLPLEVSDTCPGIGLTRVTSITLHPGDPQRIVTTVEIGGVHRSFDGGDTWARVMTTVDAPLPDGALFGVQGREDCHYSRISAGDPDVVIVSTPDSLYGSEDFGTTWDALAAKRIFPHQYHRELAIKLDDPNTIFQGIGDDTQGTEGALLRSRDRGVTWDVADLPDECNAPVWCFAQHPANADRILACTLLGMLFGSDDGGDTWKKYRREFSDVRSMCWLPNRRGPDPNPTS